MATENPFVHYIHDCLLDPLNEFYHPLPDNVQNNNFRSIDGGYNFTLVFSAGTNASNLLKEAVRLMRTRHGLPTTPEFDKYKETEGGVEFFYRPGQNVSSWWYVTSKNNFIQCLQTPVDKPYFTEAERSTFDAFNFNRSGTGARLSGVKDLTLGA